MTGGTGRYSWRGSAAQLAALLDHSGAAPDDLGDRRRTVQIPACDEHAGLLSTWVSVDWTCLACGGPRGQVFRTVSYDGSRRLAVDGWTNPCGHLDSYANVRLEAKAHRS